MPLRYLQLDLRQKTITNRIPNHDLGGFLSIFIYRGTLFVAFVLGVHDFLDRGRSYL